MNDHDLGVWFSGIAYGMALLAILERVVFPLSFRLSRLIERIRLNRN